MEGSLFHHGVIQLPREKFRIIVEREDEGGCVISVLSVNKFKWVGLTQQKFSTIVKQLKGDTIGYRWLDKNGNTKESKSDKSNELHLMIGKEWVKLGAEKYGETDTLLEKLIQLEKKTSSNANMDNIQDSIDEVKREVEKLKAMPDNINKLQSVISKLLNIPQDVTTLQTSEKQMIDKVEKLNSTNKNEMDTLRKEISDLKLISSNKNEMDSLRKDVIYLKETLQKAQMDLLTVNRYRRYWTLHGSCLRVASSAAITNGAYANWNNNASAPYNMHTTTFYNLSGTTVTLVNPGIYFVSTHISSANTGNGNYIALYQNGGQTIASYSSCASGYYHTHRLSKLIQCKNVNEQIMIYYSANANNYAPALENQLSIAYLSHTFWKEDIAALCVHSSASCINTDINWNKVEFNTNPKYFNVVGNKITIHKACWYLVSLNLNGYSSNNASQTEIRIDGATVSRSFDSDGNGYYYPITIVDVIQVNAGSTLTVNYIGNNNTYVSGYYTQQFSILALQDQEEDILSLASIGSSNNKYISWDKLIKIPSSWYTLPNNQQINFIRGGIYLVSVNISTVSTSNDGYLDIYLNGSVVSRGRFKYAAGHQKGLTLSEVIQIPAGQYIQVYINNNTPCRSDEYNTKLSIVPLQVLHF